MVPKMEPNAPPFAEALAHGGGYGPRTLERTSNPMAVQWNQQDGFALCISCAKRRVNMCKKARPPRLYVRAGETSIESSAHDTGRDLCAICRANAIWKGA